MGKPVYKHEEYTHDLASPNEIVPVLYTIFKPSSVVDVGCGIGTFLYCFKKNGVKEVTGIDGNWADKKLLAKYLEPGEFMECDLSGDIVLQRKFDMALCLEVAEHLQPEAADRLIRNLVNLSKIIVFSAAIPGQGGQNHVNEQWISYWRSKFEKHDYCFIDRLRYYFWDNEKIHWWYRQNMFIVVDKSLSADNFIYPELETGKTLDFVHPGLLGTRLKEINELRAGKYPLKTYLKMIFKRIVP